MSDFNEPYITADEPCMFSKELCVSAKEQQYALRRGALRLRVLVQTGPISPHKSLALPQRALNFRGISAKEPYVFGKGCSYAC